MLIGAAKVCYADQVPQPSQLWSTESTEARVLPTDPLSTDHILEAGNHPPASNSQPNPHKPKILSSNYSFSTLPLPLRHSRRPPLPFPIPSSSYSGPPPSLPPIQAPIQLESQPQLHPSP
ncbi:hypothetical protein P154DRAFT_524430 [Amniculicola lignicola CBS 123094]|uniref:Uncharacterized protein n=1 Tax=Amniculicola lignicola CBS 123094 TaxID=1392246 RepID=A0A6A5W7G0_9PLEO|nr:hypothetical protein P154DRAFT_524430 [Amniculicola lignicola CBS 123094]